MVFQVTRDTDYDALFSFLEKTVVQDRREGEIDYSLIGDCRRLFACVASFTERYKRLLDCVSYGYREAIITLTPANGLSLKSEGYSYSELAEAYDATYYLSDCGGFDAFEMSNGRCLDARLSNMGAIIDPQPGELILDVGCGRGELSWYLSQFCQHVVGIDYSQDAIRIANDAYIKDAKDKKVTYLCADVMTISFGKQFDKVVLADVYEHIDPPVMDRLLRHLARMLKPGGKIFIHTAPNLDWYETVYPAMRKKAWQEGGFLPKNPRSYYEQLMHINEQSPRSLHSTLSNVFSHVSVWTGTPAKKEDFNQFPTPALSNEIFAVASQESLSDFESAFFMAPISEARLDFRISVLSEQHRYALEKFQQLPVRVENRSSISVQSRSPYPVYLSYHLLTPEGETLVYDGKRTPFLRRLSPGESADVVMDIDIGNVSEGAFILRVTLVQEGVMWLDEEARVFEDFRIEIREKSVGAYG